jgi:hypothetical protein
MSTIAVFGVVAGGSAYAVSKIETGDIANKAVTAKKLDRRAVTRSKIADGAVTSSALANGAVTSSALNVTDQGVAVVGASVGPDGSVATFFNRLPPYLLGPSVPPAPRVLHEGLGSYFINWNGVDDLLLGGTIALVNVDSAGGGDADVRPNFTSHAQEGWIVSTRDTAGAPADRGFSMVVFAPTIDTENCFSCSSAK